MKIAKSRLKEIILEELHTVNEDRILKEEFDFARVLQNPDVQKMLEDFVEKAVEKVLGADPASTTRAALGAAAEE